MPEDILGTGMAHRAPAPGAGFIFTKGVAHTGEASGDCADDQPPVVEANNRGRHFLVYAIDIDQCLIITRVCVGHCKLFLVRGKRRNSIFRVASATLSTFHFGPFVWLFNALSAVASVVDSK